MPYITREKRNRLDPIIEELDTRLQTVDVEDPNNNVEGNLNYVFTKLLRMTYGDSYKDINNAIGLMFCAALEHYRTVAAPYEDIKKNINGDVDNGTDY